MENRTLILPLRVTQAEREAIRQDAEKQGMTVSGYLRWLIAKERRTNEKG